MSLIGPAGFWINGICRKKKAEKKYEWQVAGVKVKEEVAIENPA